MTRLTLTCAALLALSPAPAAAQTACNRACLTGFVDTYFKALAANDPAAVPLAPGVKITNNGKAVRLADAFWASADRTIYRWDIVNERLGDTGTEAVVQNADGSKTMYVLRLKVQNGRIAEVEAIKANQGEADRLWGPDGLKEVSPHLRLTMREAEQDSYYGHRGRFMSRNIWDRRYPVVDTERGIVLSIVRFGLKDGMKSQSAVTSNDRLVGEFYAVKNSRIQEIHAVLFNLPDAEPTGWPPEYGPGRGGK